MTSTDTYSDRSSLASDIESKAPEGRTSPRTSGHLHTGENYKVILEGCARIFRFRADSVASQPGTLFLTSYRIRFVPKPCRCTTLAQLGPPNWHSGDCEMKGPVTPWGSFLHTWPPSRRLTQQLLAQPKELLALSVHEDDSMKYAYDVPLMGIRRAILVGRELRLLCRDCRTVDIELSSEQEGEGLMRVLGALAFPRDEVLNAFAFQNRHRVGLGWDVFDEDIDANRTLLSRAAVSLRKAPSPCETYPSSVYVPASISDAELQSSAAFRSMGRVPVAVWAHPRNGSLLVRSAQPLVGLLGNRNASDERLIRELCGSSYLLLDARSRAAALGNRAMGKGTESIERGYEGAVELIFCDLGNIHHLKSTANNLVRFYSDPTRESLGGWGNDAGASASSYNSPEIGAWLVNVAQLLKSTMRIVQWMDGNGASAWTHCSDGWDRTSQMCALAQLLMDPDYRTRLGFAVVVEKNFASFGFKFRERARGIRRHTKSSSADMNGSSHLVTTPTAGTSTASAVASTAISLIPRPTSPLAAIGNATSGISETVHENEEEEASPVLMLFLDCVYQLLQQFPDRFEFNDVFLVALADAYTSGRFGTFLCNSEKERTEKKVRLETRSVWDWICSQDAFRNPDYTPYNGVLYANCSLRAMRLFEKYWGRFDFNKTEVMPMQNCYF